MAQTHLESAIADYNAGRLAEAAARCQRLIVDQPDNAEALNLMAVLALALNNFEAAAAMAERAVASAPEMAAYHGVLGMAYAGLDNFGAAENAFRQALDMSPYDAEMRRNFGDFLRRTGRLREAVDELRRAVEADPDFVSGYSALGRSLMDAGRLDEAGDAYERAIELAPQAFSGYQNLGVLRVEQDRHEEALEAFSQALQRKRASRWCGLLRDGEALPADPAADFEFVTATKLRHDADQLRHLMAQQLLGPEFEAVATAYDGVQAEVRAAEPAGGVVALTPEQKERIGESYNRLLHLADAPALANGALNPALDIAAIRHDYENTGPGVVAVDNFLSTEALTSLRRFCLDSTIWFDVRHPRGYIGAFIEEGFNCPLLLQLMTELKAAFPDILGPHRLRKMWAYKCDNRMQAIPIHADESAVNVNFWITPDSANLDPASGGLIVHTREAPLEWDFADYNGDEAAIRKFLASGPCEAITVPYRQNRALIFNSNLFHESDGFEFNDAYADRRINITMLFGHRARPKADKT